MYEEVVLLAGLFKMATCYETDYIRPVYCIKSRSICSVLSDIAERRLQYVFIHHV